MSYIGNDLRSGRSETYVYTASGDETSVTASDDSRAINYTVGWERVWLNGVLLVGGSGNDYQATTGNSITGLAALSPNDILVLEANHTFSVSDSVPRSGGTFDGAVIFDGSIQQKTTTQNLSGIYSTEQLFLNDSYTLTGDITVSGHLALASVADSDVVITNDSSARTITGSGLLESGRLMNDVPSLTGMTGVIGDSVTGGSGFVGFHNWISILSKDFVNGGGFATAFSKTIPISKLHPDGTTHLEVEYQLSSDGGGNAPRYFKYSTSGGVTTSETVIGNADSGTIEGSFNINIPNGISSDIVINIGTSRGGGGNNTAYSGSNIVVTEVG